MFVVSIKRMLRMRNASFLNISYFKKRTIAVSHRHSQEKENEDLYFSCQTEHDKLVGPLKKKKKLFVLFTVRFERTT